MATQQATVQIREWRSIVTLLVFVFTNVNVVFPFHAPLLIPTAIVTGFWKVLRSCRIIDSDQRQSELDRGQCIGQLKVVQFPMNFVTAPLIADVFLLAIGAIGREEVHDGILGSDGISPIDILIFFLTLAYIAISIDASGLVRYLAFRVLKWGGKFGHKLYFYLYAFFFSLGSLIGNDPIVLSGTAFLAYLTRVSGNIKHPRAWIHSQFAVANIAPAILVSSNPTNLVLAGAFNIKFVTYTANMVVPVVITAIVLFPLLLFVIFGNEHLIPSTINIRELPEAMRDRAPVNPNIPYKREVVGDSEGYAPDDILLLEEIMHPFVDKSGAAFSATMITVTLVTILALNAASTGVGEQSVFYITIPAALVTLCWDFAFGWFNRKQTRDIARNGPYDTRRNAPGSDQTLSEGPPQSDRNPHQSHELSELPAPQVAMTSGSDLDPVMKDKDKDGMSESIPHFTEEATAQSDPVAPTHPTSPHNRSRLSSTQSTLGDQCSKQAEESSFTSPEAKPVRVSGEQQMVGIRQPATARADHVESGSTTVDPAAQQTTPFKARTLQSISRKLFRWFQETFPTPIAVLVHLPYALVFFALSMFVLVQALISKGWVQVFAHGWDHWVNKTGTVGSIGGMGFLAVVLCNFAGTNIGAAILLCRVIQAWQAIHRENHIPISDRTFWATVYSMALGVNYGAFSATFSASLAGLLWRDILERKHVTVLRRDFARVNLPIISIAMTVGCLVLIAQVYISRDDSPYQISTLRR